MCGDSGEDRERRAYWTQQMDAALRLMRAVALLPVEECGEPMVSIQAAARNAGVEMAFSNARAADGSERLFLIREGLVRDLIGAARTMNRHGWVLKVEDAYRTVNMQRSLASGTVFETILGRVLWERKGVRPTAAKMLHRVSALVATVPRVGTHMSGSAVDISVLKRDSGEEVDRGAPYLEMSEKTPMDSPFVSEEASANRKKIRDIMARYGFVAYPYEFWHYSQGDVFAEYLLSSGKVARYGPVEVDLETGRTTPLANPTQPLVALDEIHRNIERAMERASGAR